MALIETKDLWKTYVMGTEEVHALQGVSIQIERGEYVAIMGPSGSGKSTLMNLIGCLDTPSKGSYLLNGKQVNEGRNAVPSDGSICLQSEGWPVQYRNVAVKELDQ